MGGAYQEMRGSQSQLYVSDQILYQSTAFPHLIERSWQDLFVREKKEESYEKMLLIVEKMMAS